ncbi:MAG: 16S rRNA (uracil(1498)-N(3))-methyltransferase [Desulfobacter sp.]|nr:MAG: 16S rRNA (uracil(1498)-N(3))-methyltransferase [Desulfobacter sp.]
MQKFIVSDATESGQQVRISGQDARHICRVLRLKIGDPLSMTDGRGRDFTGKIDSVSPDRIEVEVEEEGPSQSESALELTLCTAMLKHKKMDEIIKQATQLGITRWIPFYSARSVPRANPKKEKRQMERWQSIAVESLKQCRRSRLVEILAPVPFDEMLDLVKGHSHKIAFWEEGGLPLSRIHYAESHSAAVLIGPEGGFDVQEIEVANGNGFAAYSLGPRILRAETAAVCAAGIVQYLLGDMGGAERG